MEIRWLEDFLSLVDTRNFSRSAELRFTTQPAFSRRIKSLEEWLGATLFDRRTQPINLTPAGERFRPVAEEVLRRLYQSREAIRRADAASAGTLSFAATHSLSLTFFPEWIRTLESDAGALITRLDSNHAHSCVQSLLKGECQFMLCHAHPSVEMNLPAALFPSLKVGKDRLIPVSAPNQRRRPIHALPGRKDAPISYLCYAETSVIGQAVENRIAQDANALHLNRVFVSHLAAVLTSMAREGRGLAWLPEAQIRRDLAARTLVPAGDETWIIPIEIRLFRSADPLPPAAEDFWTIVKRHADAGSALD